MGRPTSSAIPADGLIVNGLMAIWPSIVLYGRSARTPIEQESLCMLIDIINGFMAE